MALPRQRRNVENLHLIWHLARSLAFQLRQEGTKTLWKEWKKRLLLFVVGDGGKNWRLLVFKDCMGSQHKNLMDYLLHISLVARLSGKKI